LEQQKAVQPLIQRDKVSKKRAQHFLQYPLSNENLVAFQKFQQLITLKGYSEKTLKTYGTEFHYLLRLLGEVPCIRLQRRIFTPTSCGSCKSGATPKFTFTRR